MNNMSSDIDQYSEYSKTSKSKYDKHLEIEAKYISTMKMQ